MKNPSDFEDRLMAEADRLDAAAPSLTSSEILNRADRRADLDGHRPAGWWSNRRLQVAGVALAGACAVGGAVVVANDDGGSPSTEVAISTSSVETTEADTVPQGEELPSTEPVASELTLFPTISIGDTSYSVDCSADRSNAERGEQIAQPSAGADLPAPQPAPDEGIVDASEPQLSPPLVASDSEPELGPPLLVPLVGAAWQVVGFDGQAIIVEYNCAPDISEELTEVIAYRDHAPSDPTTLEEVRSEMVLRNERQAAECAFATIESNACFPVRASFDSFPNAVFHLDHTVACQLRADQAAVELEQSFSDGWRVCHPVAPTPGGVAELLVDLTERTNELLIPPAGRAGAGPVDQLDADRALLSVMVQRQATAVGPLPELPVDDPSELIPEITPIAGEWIVERSDLVLHRGTSGEWFVAEDTTTSSTVGSEGLDDIWAEGDWEYVFEIDS